MNRILLFLSISIFSIFVGSQIVEGFLLVPYWKSLSSGEFYAYYAKFGPTIGKFYTMLTIIAAVIPIGVALFCFLKKTSALRYSVISSIFMLLVIGSFYLYFKEINQQFYESAFSASQLELELQSWGNWHWLRVLFEILSLIFLILCFNILSQTKATS